MRFVCVHGTSFVSKLIEWQSRGPESHALLRFSDDMVFESREWHYDSIRRRHVSGVASMSWANWRLVNPCAIFTIYEVPLPPETEARMRTWAQAQLGKPYDYLGVARFITRKGYDTQPDDKWWCSEYVFQDFLDGGGVRLFENTEGWQVAPDWLPRTPLARRIG